MPEWVTPKSTSSKMVVQIEVLVGKPHKNACLSLLNNLGTINPSQGTEMRAEQNHSNWFLLMFPLYFHCIFNRFQIEICGGGVSMILGDQIFDFHKLSPFLGFSEPELIPLQILALNSKYSSRYILLHFGAFCKKTAVFLQNVTPAGMEPLKAQHEL